MGSVERDDRGTVLMQYTYIDEVYDRPVPDPQAPTLLA